MNDDKMAKKLENNANNTEAVKTAADVASKAGGVPGAIGKGIQIADKVSGGKASEKLGKAATTSFAHSGIRGKLIQNNINRTTRKLNGKNNVSNTSNNDKDGLENDQTPENSNGNNVTSSDDKAKATIKIPKTITIKIILILLPIVIFLLMFITIIGAISGGYSGSSSEASGNGSVTINRVNGIGNYFVEGQDSNYFNSSVVYIDDNGKSTTYDVNELIAGGIYALTEDNLSINIYKVYAILLRTNILSDSDGVIVANDYKFKDASNSYSYTLINRSVEDTKYEILLDSNNSVVKTDFSNNDCESCTIEDGVSLNIIKSLVNQNNYNYEQVIEELFSGRYTISRINFSAINNSISLELKDTTKSTYLDRTITEFLNSHGSSLEDLNNYISSNVQPIYGTGKAVATAAVSLINYLYDGFGIKLPYYWGGKYEHVGANPSFGVYKPVPRSNGQVYKYISLDCSGLAQWAIINGGIKNPGTGTVNFAQAFTNRCNITSPSCIGEVGDLINYRTHDNSRGHVQVIVSVDKENNSYYIAESSTNGVVVTTRPMHKGRDDATVYVLHMTDYYAKNVRK